MSDTDDEIEVSQEFIDLVKEYVTLDDQIKESTQEMRIVKKRKKEVDSKIKEYMIVKDIPELGINDGLLKVYKSKQTKPLKRDNILKILSEELGAEKGKEITDRIFNSREITHTDKIRRIKKKK